MKKDYQKICFILIIPILTIFLFIPITTFADHSEVTIIPASGSGTPGCETIANGCFLPSTATVDVGGVVIFSNTDSAAHTFTSGVSGYFGEEEPLGPDGEFDTGLLMVGNSFSHTFDKEGIYDYFCMVHPWMTGIIFVDENYSSVPKYVDIQLFIDKESYTEGDTIRVFGTISDDLGIDVSLTVTKPGGKIVSLDQFAVKSDKTFETQIVIGPLFDVDGVYSVQVGYGPESTDLVAFEFHQLIQDRVPPLLLVPSNILIDTVDPQGIRVDYSVKAIDDVDGVVESFCNPSSGRLFPIGNTIVTCQTFDNAGNSMLMSFTIIVQLDPPLIGIPDWVKEVAAFWCNDTINDASFIEAVQYLIENNVILVPLNYDSGVGTGQIIPDWVKNNACWWSQNLISDDEFASGLEYLINQGIITV